MRSSRMLVPILVVVFCGSCWSYDSPRLSWFNFTNHVNIVETVLSQEEAPVEISENELFLRKQASKYIQGVIPPFVISKEVSKNKQCVLDSQVYLEAINNFQLWALSMYDSNAKVPSGLLNGNLNQFGDFDRCLNTKPESVDFRSKYCLSFIQLHLPKEESANRMLKNVYDLMHSHRAFQSKLSDSGHRVPRYSTINWGVCLPSSCRAVDVQSQLEAHLLPFANASGFDVEVRVEENMCQVRSSSYSSSFILVTIILLSFVALSITAAIFERSNHNSTSVLLCFSLKRNFDQLFSFKRDPNDIATVHGIRMFNSIMLLLSHKSMAMFFNPYTNRTTMADNLSQQWTVLARAAALYTDPFIMMSGLLTGLSFIKSLRRTGSIDIRREYISRLIRMVPGMAAIILVCTFILPEVGSGPQWNLTVSHHAEKCKKYWWRNFLFIHNYYGFDDMCLTHTHHIGIDTQLFFLSPILVYIVHRWKMNGVGFLVGVAAVSTALRYYATFVRRLSYFIYPGINNLQMIQTADFSYTLPAHRISMYIMGILLAFAMDYCGKDYKLKQNVRRFGWMVTLSLFYYSYIKPSAMGIRGYVYSEYDAANYAALAPLGWSLIFAWIIFISNIGYGGVVAEIFSQRFGPIWTRLSYSIYLTQFPIYFYNVGLQRSPIEYSFFYMLNLWELWTVFLASVALSLFVEYPFNNLRKWYLRR